MLIEADRAGTASAQIVLNDFIGLTILRYLTVFQKDDSCTQPGYGFHAMAHIQYSAPGLRDDDFLAHDALPFADAGRTDGAPPVIGASAPGRL